MNLLNIFILTTIFVFKDNGTVEGFGTTCHGSDCLVSPIPVCPLNGVYSEQENGCVITEPIIKSCPEGFKSTSGVQCSKNVHTGKILTCPDNVKYNKHKQECYMEKKETPKCKADYLEDGDGNCYKLKDAQMKCGTDEDEKEDGCYSYKMVKKEHNCDEIPERIKLMHKSNANTYISSTAQLEGELEYKSNGLMNSVCKIKVFHKPSCPENSIENELTGECITETFPEIHCDDGYILKDKESNGQIQHTNPHGIAGIRNRHYCEKSEYVEAITECPDGMIKEKDNTGREVCLLYGIETPKICPVGFTYNDRTKNCIRKQQPDIKCDKGYIFKNGYCYLIEREVNVGPEKTSSIPYCADPEAVVVGQYCINNQSLVPNIECPNKYDYSEYSNKCENEIEIEPIQTCPPRYVLNIENQICERRIEKDCSTLKFRKQCTSYNQGVGSDEHDNTITYSGNTIEGSSNRNLGTFHHHGHGHHGHTHYAGTSTPTSHQVNQIVHQCVEIPEHIQKTCVNVETAPIVYVCHDGTKTTERRCIKKNQVAPKLTCPKGFMFKNGECVRQKVESVKYKCLEGFNLTYIDGLKVGVPYCLSETTNTIQKKKPDKVEALYSCNGENMTLNTNGYNNKECTEIKSPECRHIGCRYLIRSVDPKWICPVGSQMSNEYLQNMKMTYNNNRMLIINESHNNGHKHSINNSLVYSNDPAPKCVVSITKDINVKCKGENSILNDNGKCINKTEKVCPSDGCENTLEFNPVIKCPKNTEQQGSHNGDLCKMSIKKPFKYYCQHGGKIVMHNKCRHIEKKMCKHLNCTEYIKVEGKMQCPPGYSETKHVMSGNTDYNNEFTDLFDTKQIDLFKNQGGITGMQPTGLSPSSLSVYTSFPTSLYPLQTNQMLALTDYSHTSSGNVSAHKRRLFGTVRPLSNSGQCAALEFAPYILSCRSGFTESDGKCFGVVDATYQCPGGTVLRQDGLCSKVISDNNVQHYSNTRKNI